MTWRAEDGEPTTRDHGMLHCPMHSRELMVGWCTVTSGGRTRSAALGAIAGTTKGEGSGTLGPTTADAGMAPTATEWSTTAGAAAGAGDSAGTTGAAG